MVSDRGSSSYLRTSSIGLPLPNYNPKEVRNMQEVKSNKVDLNDKDFYELTKELITKQLKERNPKYDGSSLVLGGDKNGSTSR